MVHFARTTVNLSVTSGTFSGARVLPVVMHLLSEWFTRFWTLNFEALHLAAKTMVTAGINTWINFGEPPQLEHSGCHEWGAKGVSENDSDDVSKTDGIRHNIYIYICGSIAY